jgi:hypothetical protein
MLMLRSKLCAFYSGGNNMEATTQPALVAVTKATPGKSTSSSAKSMKAAGETASSRHDVGAGAGGGIVTVSNQSRCHVSGSEWPARAPSLLSRVLLQTTSPGVVDLPYIDGRYVQIVRMVETSSADVCSAHCVRSGADVVLKRLHCSPTAALKQVTMAGAVNGIEGCCPLLDVVRDGLSGLVVLCFPRLRQRSNIRSTREIHSHTVSVLQTLARLHASGIVHLDIKPEHVVFDDSDNPVLIDTGIACALPTCHETRCLPIAGTDGFMAPEVATGVARDPRCDVYSLGRTLEKWMAHARHQVPVMSVVDETRYETVLQRCKLAMLQPEPAQRCTVTDALAILAVANRSSAITSTLPQPTSVAGKTTAAVGQTMQRIPLATLQNRLN